MHSTRTLGASGPIFMIAPLPYDFSICAIARFSAFFRSSCVAVTPIVASNGLPVRGDVRGTAPVRRNLPSGGRGGDPAGRARNQVNQLPNKIRRRAEIARSDHAGARGG